MIIFCLHVKTGEDPSQSINTGRWLHIFIDRWFSRSGAAFPVTGILLPIHGYR